MKSVKLVIVIALALGIGLSVMPVTARAEVVTTFQGNDGDLWSFLGSWDNGVPDGTIRAVIDNGKRCVIDVDVTDAAARRIKIDGAGSIVQMLSGSIPTIGQQDTARTSKIINGGALNIDANGALATLRISGDHTIIGDDGEINMIEKPIIDHNDDPDDHLTIEGSCTGALLRTCSLTVQGLGEIRVALFNDAFVVGNTFADALCLTEEGKEGGCDGFWVAQNFGTLLVQSTIVGEASWHAQDEGNDDSGGTITIGDGVAGCVSAEGPVFVRGDNAEIVVRSDGEFWLTGAGGGRMTIADVSKEDTDQGRIAVGDTVVAAPDYLSIPAALTLGAVESIETDPANPLLSMVTVRSALRLDTVRRVYVYDPGPDDGP